MWIILIVPLLLFFWLHYYITTSFQHIPLLSFFWGFCCCFVFMRLNLVRITCISVGGSVNKITKWVLGFGFFGCFWVHLKTDYNGTIYSFIYLWFCFVFQPEGRVFWEEEPQFKKKKKMSPCRLPRGKSGAFSWLMILWEGPAHCG